MLRSELLDLRSVGFDLSLTGFDSADLAALFAPRTGETDPDEAPPAPVVPVSQPGDLWILGDHRLICGSSTDPTTVERLLNGARPHLMVTDPPYGVEYDPNWRNSADRSTKIKGRKIGATSVGEVMNDDRADWREAFALFVRSAAKRRSWSMAMILVMVSLCWRLKHKSMWKREVKRGNLVLFAPAGTCSVTGDCRPFFRAETARPSVAAMSTRWIARGIDWNFFGLRLPLAAPRGGIGHREAIMKRRKTTAWSHSGEDGGGLPKPAVAAVLSHRQSSSMGLSARAIARAARS